MDRLKDQNEGIDRRPGALEQVALECLGIDRIWQQLREMPPSHRHILTTRQVVEAIVSAYETGFWVGRQQVQLEDRAKNRSSKT